MLKEENMEEVFLENLGELNIIIRHFRFPIYVRYFASRSVLRCLECTKLVFLPNPVAGFTTLSKSLSWLGRTSPFLTPSTPTAPRSRRLQRITLSYIGEKLAASI